MKKFKNIYIIFLILLSFSLCTCDGSKATGGNIDGDNPAENGDNNKDDNDDNILTVMTFNVIDFSYTGYSLNEHEAVAEIIERNDVDIIALQEAPLGDTEVISCLEGRITLYSTSSNKSNDNVALYSRYTIKSSNTILTGSYQDPVSGSYYSMYYLRPVLEVCLDVDGTDYWFYVCHLKAYAGGTNLAKRRAQTYALAQYINNKFTDVNAEKIIILGDMNTVDAPDTNAYDDWDTEGTMGYLTLQHDSDPANDFTAVNYTYIPDQATYPGSGSVIDHIIASPGLIEEYVPDSTGVVTSPRPSDHYPVYAEFYLE